MSTKAQSDDAKRVAPDLDRKWIEATVDGDSFVPITKILDSMAEMVKLRFAPDSIQVQAVNNAQTIMADVDYTDVEYNGDLDSGVEIAVAAERLHRVLSSLDKDDGTLSMLLTAGEKDMTASKGNHMNYIELYDPDPVHSASLPDFTDDLDPEAEIHTVDLKSIVGAVSGGSSDALLLNIEDEGLVSTYYQLPDEADSNPAVECKTDGDSITCFGCDTLWTVVGAMHPSGKVTLRNRDDYPLEIQTEHATYIVAPSMNLEVNQ